jgi:hypothetical protein
MSLALFVPLCILAALAVHLCLRSFLLGLVTSGFVGSLLLVTANAFQTGPIDPFIGIAIFFGGIYSVAISIVVGVIIRLVRSMKGHQFDEGPPSIR